MMIARAPLVYRLFSLVTVLFFVGLVSWPKMAAAAPSAEQRKLARKCEDVLKAANKLIDSGDIEKAARYVKLTQQKVAELEAASDPDDRQWSIVLKPLKRRLDQTRGTLELEGFTLPAIKVTPKPAPTDNKPATPDDPPSEKFKPDPSNISFKHEIAPILQQRCAGCHGGNKPKGDLSMATFRLLARGVGGSAIIDPGESNISQMIEVIRSGDMPKGGGKVSRGELALLASWIDQGAKFDGGNPDTPLRELAAANSPSSPTTPAPAPTRPGEVAFSTHIAPVLAQRCINCHGPQRPRNQLNLSTFQTMMRGGMNGAAIQPGNLNGSLLLQKIKGTAADGARMPLNAAPLAANVIADFEKWVAAGAKFDGPDPNLPVSQVAALAVARNSNHQQLRQLRSEQADKNWQLALSDVEPVVMPTDNFLVYGSAKKEKLAEIAKLAEQQQSQIRAMLALPADEPLVKGNITLYVFGLKVDYSEFAFMVEQRKMERSSRGHWRYTIVDAYGAVVPPGSRDDYGLDVLVAQQIASAAVAARGSAPMWFSEGVGRSVAAKTNAEDSRVAVWLEQLPTAAKQMAKPDDFMTGNLPPEDAAIVSYGFVSALMKKDRQFKMLLGKLWKGEAFDAAFQGTYGRPPAEMAAAWVQSGAKPGGAPRR
jgi:hypothetical protein